MHILEEFSSPDEAAREFTPRAPHQWCVPLTLIYPQQRQRTEEQVGASVCVVQSGRESMAKSHSQHVSPVGSPGAAGCDQAQTEAGQIPS